MEGGKNTPGGGEKMARDISGISDCVFKEIFSDKSILVEYINQICNINLKVDDVEYSPLESKEMLGYKGVRYDVKAKGENENKYFHIDFEAQKIRPDYNTFKKRKFHYASQLYLDLFKEGDKYLDSSRLYVREIFFIKSSNGFNGSPIKKIVYQDLYDKTIYDDIEIYEIYIDELQKLDLNKADNYVKMLVELTGVIVAKDVEKYKRSKNTTVRRVAERIMKYTQEEIEELQRRYDEACEQLDQALILDMQEEAMEKGLAQGLAQGREEGHAEGHAQGLAQGRAEGKTEALIENIKTMHSNGFSEETISKALSLDIDFVKKALEE